MHRHHHLHEHLEQPASGDAGQRNSGRAWRGGPAGMWARTGEARAAFGPFGGPWGGPFGPPMGGGRGRGRGPGGRARRGDVRTAVIALLAERPMHGYEIIQELSERTGGLWKPSPGSVYPTLQLLEDEGHVVAEAEGGKRQFALTESGRELAAGFAGQKAPWEQVTDATEPEIVRLRDAAGQLLGALMQIGQAGSPEQQAAAEAVLHETRRKLYTILAGDD